MMNTRPMDRMVRDLLVLAVDFESNIIFIKLICVIIISIIHMQKSELQ